MDPFIFIRTVGMSPNCFRASSHVPSSSSKSQVHPALPYVGGCSLSLTATCTHCGQVTRRASLLPGLLGHLSYADIRLRAAKGMYADVEFLKNLLLFQGGQYRSWISELSALEISSVVNTLPLEAPARETGAKAEAPEQAPKAASRWAWDEQEMARRLMMLPT